MHRQLVVIRKRLACHCIVNARSPHTQNHPGNNVVRASIPLFKDQGSCIPKTTKQVSVSCDNGIRDMLLYPCNKALRTSITKGT